MQLPNAAWIRLNFIVCRFARFVPSGVVCRHRERRGVQRDAGVVPDAVCVVQDIRVLGVRGAVVTDLGKYCLL